MFKLHYYFIATSQTSTLFDIHRSALPRQMFIINGERHSGTIFIAELLERNNLHAFTGFIHGSLSFIWKHGFPEKRHKKLSCHTRGIHLIMLRDLDEWLISMFYNPYHLFKYDEFTDFLTKPQHSIAHEGMEHELIDVVDSRAVNIHDEGKTIFEIRNEKNRAYLNFYSDNQDVILVNLKYLQNKDNCRHFLETINEKYNIGMTKIINEIEYNVKTLQVNNKKTEYDLKITEEHRKLINSFKDVHMERFIENLTFLIKA